MGLNNAHVYYSVLVDERIPGKCKLTFGECVKILMHHLMQSGPDMRRYKPDHPAFVRDLENVFEYGTGRVLQSDAHGDVARRSVSGKQNATTAHLSPCELPAKKIKYNPCDHRSVPVLKKGRCRYKNFPGRNRTENKRARAYETQLHCAECSSREGKTFYLCNTVKDEELVQCHMKYHKEECDNDHEEDSDGDSDGDE